MLNTYRIPKMNMPELGRRLERINRRAHKLGLAPITLTVTGQETERHVTLGMGGESVPYYVEFALVELSGETPMIAGWTFTATIQRITGDDGKVATIVRAVPGQELPEAFRRLESGCDHCRLARLRRDTYVLRNATGDYKQVGSSCLADFTGVNDPHAVAALAEMLCQIDSDAAGLCDPEWEGGGGRGADRAYDLEWFLARVATVCRVSGWVSRKAAQASFLPKMATVDTVAQIVYAKETDKDYKDLVDKYGKAPSEADGETARAAIEWARALANKYPITDYESNVLAVVGLGAAPASVWGIAASIVGCYLRETEQAILQAAKANEYVGEVGARLEGLAVVCKVIRGYESNWGEGDRVVFEDGAGNQLVWFTSSAHFAAEGESYTIKATVKKQEEYRGRRQTIITRVAEFVPKVKRARAAKSAHVVAA